MWRKILTVCLFATIWWRPVEAGFPVQKIDESIERIIPETEHSKAIPNGRRIALVIGNADYANNPLGTPLNDARAMSDTLRSLGFEVMRYENASRQSMQEALLDFNRRLAAGGVGLFYFAGHGMRVDGRTLLVPVDADSRSPVRLLTRGIDLREVLGSMSGPRPDMLNLIVLDTCLNNPFANSETKVSDSHENTLIAYATAPGSFAADGVRHVPHGLYTAELLKAMAVPGRDIEEVFRRVESGVRESSRQRQRPWISSSLSSAFHFVTGPRRIGISPDYAALQEETAPMTRSRAILPKDSAEQYELTFWESIKDSEHIGDYEAYLQAYPKGRFAALARARIERLRAATPKAETPPATQPAPPAKARPAPTVKTPPEPARPPAKVEPEQARPAPVIPPPEKPAAVSELKDCPACPTLIALPPGTFTIGSNTSDPSEKPAHRVSINTPFAIGKYEVTVEQWNACVEAGACQRVNGDNEKNAPARDVSWEDAQQYVKWLSKVSGKAYRLPTEAEWEYAARGGTSTQYWWGEQMRKGTANCKDCGEPWRQDSPVNVGSFAANPFGLHDVNGSVWEWVSDCWHNSYKGAPADSRAWDEPNCRDRVIRGGSWREGASYMLSSTRFKYAGSVRHSQNGFRVARDLQ